MRKHDDNPRTFEAWMALADDRLLSKIGVSSDDLPDVCYRNLFDTGCTPEEAADVAIDNAMNC